MFDGNNYLWWLEQLRQAIEQQREEVLEDNQIEAERKGQMLRNLDQAHHRVVTAQGKGQVSGLTTELKSEILQAVIEAMSGGLLNS